MGNSFLFELLNNTLLICSNFKSNQNNLKLCLDKSFAFLKMSLKICTFPEIYFNIKKHFWKTFYLCLALRSWKSPHVWVTPRRRARVPRTFPDNFSWHKFLMKNMILDDAAGGQSPQNFSWHGNFTWQMHLSCLDCNGYSHDKLLLMTSMI